MQDELTIIEDLREIENVTNINGCFLLRAKDNAIIESTIPLKIHDEILWEIAVLRDTFQQFSTGLTHGLLKNITLEGERGFIFIYNLPPHFILLAMSSKEVILSNIQITVIDILIRLSQKIEKYGETLLNASAKAFAAVGEGAKIPTQVNLEKKGKKTAEILTTSTVSTAAEAHAVKTELKKKEKNAPITVEPTPVQQTPVVTPTVEEPQVVPSSGQQMKSISEILPELKGKSQKEKNAILSGIFEKLKIDIKSATGSEIAVLLEVLKDSILENFGTSLALFDISKNARDFKNVHNLLAPQQVLLFRDRITNWAQRIIK